MAVLRKLLQLILFLVVLQLGRSQSYSRISPSQEHQQLTQRVEALEDDVEGVKNSTLAIMNILVTIKDDLAALREDTQDVKRELETVMEDTQDVKRELDTVKEDTQDVKRGLETVREDTQNVTRDIASLREDVKRDLATSREDTQDVKRELETVREDTQDVNRKLVTVMEDTRDVKRELATVMEYTQDVKKELATVNEDIQDVKRELETVREDTKSMSQNTESALKNITTDQAMKDTMRDLQVEMTSLKQNTLYDVKVDPRVSVQYLPTSCDEIAQMNPKSPLGYYWIHSETNINGIQVLCSSPQTPALSCEHIATHYQHTPSGYYWVETSNGSAVNVYCDNHLTSPDKPSLSCQDIVKMYPSTPSGYYWVRSSNGSAVNVYCYKTLLQNFRTSQQDPAPSCQHIAETHPSIPSGYYWVESSNGSAVNVYCDNNLTSPDNPSPSCQDIVKMHPSTPPGYYWVESSNSSAVNVYCYMTSQQDPAPSCQHIAETHPSTPSGYYWVRSSNGSAVNVYCDMARHCCGSTGGWMRVAYLDMTDTNQQCPEELRLRSEPKRTCEMITRSGYDSIFYPSHDIQYSKVCGRVRAYQYGPTIAFCLYYTGYYAPTIDDNYVEGMSITHGESPRKHIWTFAAARDETHSNYNVCPCTRTDTPYTGSVPPFIGNDYFCDTGSRELLVWRFNQNKFYSEDPLWDGEGCGPNSTCCQFNSPPWFCKELPQPTTDDVEVRVGRHNSFRNIPIELIELYIQ